MINSTNSSEVLLRATNLVRQWGGLVAVKKVEIELKRGEIHAVIRYQWRWKIDSHQFAFG